MTLLDNPAPSKYDRAVIEVLVRSARRGRPLRLERERIAREQSRPRTTPMAERYESTMAEGVACSIPPS